MVEMRVGDGAPYLRGTLTVGGPVTNPLLKPCPRCGAERYERCRKPIKEDGRVYYLPDLHADRVGRNGSKKKKSKSLDKQGSHE